LVTRNTPTKREQEAPGRSLPVGRKPTASAVITAIRDPAGNLKGFAKVTRGLTEKQQALEALRKSEERVRLILETAHDALRVVALPPHPLR